MFEQGLDKFDLREFAQEMVLDEGKKAVGYFYDFTKSDVKYKTVNNKKSIVTTYDIEINNSIIKKIEKKYPTHSILTEESGMIDKKSDWLWVIDPIDGTRFFAEHREYWSVSVGLFYKNDFYLGAVYAPFLDKMYLSLKNEGVFKNNKRFYFNPVKKEKYSVLFVSSRNQEKINILNKMQKHFESLNNIDAKKMEFPTTMCLMDALDNIYDAVIVIDANLWDVAGMGAVLDEVGYKILNKDGNRFDISSKVFFASHIYSYDVLYNHFMKWYDDKS